MVYNCVIEQITEFKLKCDSHVIKMAAVELGFVEERSDFGPFPSKVGGKPAWMVMDGLPGKEVLACKRCQQPLLLLLQISVPLRGTQDAPVHSYHRTLYIFTCTDASCHRSEVDPATVALRCQLPRENAYYPPDVESGEVEEKDTPAICDGANTPKQNGTKEEGAPLVQPLCVVCGCPAPHCCGKCRKARYCSKAHQVHDWKTGHRYHCDEDPEHPTKENKEAMKILLKEFDIVTEEEPEVPCKEEGEDRSDEERMREYCDYVKSEHYRSEVVKGEVVTDEETDKDVTDKQYKCFKRAVAVEPEQVRILARWTVGWRVLARWTAG